MLLNGTALVFNLLPNSLFWGYTQEFLVILYSVGLVIILGFKRAFKPVGFFKALLSSTVVIVTMLFSLATFFERSISNPDTVWASTGMIVFGLVQAVGIGQGGMLFQRRDSEHPCEKVCPLCKGRMVCGPRRFLNFRNRPFVQHFQRIRSFGCLLASNFRYEHRSLFRRCLFEKQKPLGTDFGTRADRYGSAFKIHLPYTNSRRNGQRPLLGSTDRYGNLHFAHNLFAPSF